MATGAPIRKFASYSGRLRTSVLENHEQGYDSNAALHGRFRTGMDGEIDRNLNPRHRSADGHTHSASQRDRAQVELYQTLC
jgi:hypothetical protein